MQDPDDGGYGGALPVAQERSRRTRERLLDAAEWVLTRDGLEGATVPAIARKAGVAVGSVYRRYPDKDALLRAVYERFFNEGLETNREGLAPEQWQGVPAAEMLRRLVGGMVRGYRLKRGVLRALLRYAETHADEDFRRRALELREESFRLIGDLLADRAGELGHPRLREAVPFALTVMRLALQGFILHDAGGAELSERKLAEELTRMLCGYLGADAT